MKKDKRGEIILLRSVCVLLGAALAAAIIMSVIVAGKKTDTIPQSALPLEQLKAAEAWQLSAEAEGLMQQAFSLAKTRLDEAIEDNGGSGKGLAIVTDCDDTIVDGAHYTADVLQGGAVNNIAFAKFLMTDACSALPGALNFFDYAASKDVEIFYITNRSEKGYKKGENGYTGADGYQEGRDSVSDALGISMYDITLKQLAYLGFPMADSEHIILPSLSANSSGSKEEARKGIEEKGLKTVLLLGDDLNDFTDDFALEATERAKLATDGEYSGLWGTVWILLPNAVYGSWINSIAGGDYTAVFDSVKYTNYPPLKAVYGVIDR